MEVMLLICVCLPWSAARPSCLYTYALELSPISPLEKTFQILVGKVINRYTIL